MWPFKKKKYWQKVWHTNDVDGWVGTWLCPFELEKTFTGFVELARKACLSHGMPETCQFNEVDFFRMGDQEYRLHVYFNDGILHFYRVDILARKGKLKVKKCYGYRL